MTHSKVPHIAVVLWAVALTIAVGLSIRYGLGLLVWPLAAVAVGVVVSKSNKSMKSPWETIDLVAVAGLAVIVVLLGVVVAMFEVSSLPFGLVIAQIAATIASAMAIGAHVQGVRERQPSEKKN